MDPAVAGLIGAGIGAIAGMAGTLIAHSLQLKSEQNKWLLSKREEAYSNSLRYLLKSLNQRSKITADGTAILAQSEMPDWFRYLSEAQSWITALTIYSSSETREPVSLISAKFNGIMSMFMGSGLFIAADESGEIQDGKIQLDDGLSNLAEMIALAYTEILKCAQTDLGKHVGEA